jgi:hypothetical protein
MNAGEKIPIGILYEAEPAPTYASRFRENVVKGPLTGLKPPEREEMVSWLDEFRMG